jgi:hypothetical protein
VLVLVDNCYGEFTEEKEPTAVGAGEGRTDTPFIIIQQLTDVTT